MHQFLLHKEVNEITRILEVDLASSVILYSCAGFCPDLDITNSKGKYTWKNIKKDQSNDEECAQDKEKKATVECNSSDCVEGAVSSYNSRI